MQFAGAVEATKYLRDKGESLASRTATATLLLDDNSKVILPRREIVLLEWVFDTIDFQKEPIDLPELWLLLKRAWVASSENSRLRILKNHKFIPQAAQTVKVGSTNLIRTIREVLLLISETVPLMSYATIPQAKQLVLAYLSNDSAIKDNELGEFLFGAVNTRNQLFGKADPSVITLISNEPVRDHRLNYLVDYLSSPSNDVANDQEKYSPKLLQEIVSAICISKVELKKRFLKLCSLYQNHTYEVFEILCRNRLSEPGIVTELLELIFKRDSLDYKTIDLCLETDPEPLLADADKLARMTTDPELPDHTMALTLTRLARLRLLVDFLPKWAPSKDLSNELKEAGIKSIDALSPMQVAQLLSQIAEKSSTLQFVISSLSYQLASSTSVSAILESLFQREEVPSDTKALILEVLPNLGLSINRKHAKQTELRLRIDELQMKNKEIKLSDKPKNLDCDQILLRFFPLLETREDDPEFFESLVKHTSEETRLQLAKSPRALECAKVTSALIDRAIRKKEIAVLQALPKSVFSWDQRHNVVDMALKSRDNSFSEIGGIIVKLFDSQHFPDLHKFTKFLDCSTSKEADVDVLVQLLKLVRKDSKFMQGVRDSVSTEWLRMLATAVFAEFAPELFSATTVSEWLARTHLDPELRDVILTILPMLPAELDQTKFYSQNLALFEISTKKNLHPKLFNIIASQQHPWYTVSALYLFVSEGLADESFLNYCAQLDPSQFRDLLFACVDDSQYQLLTALAHQRLLSASTDHAYQLAITTAVCKVDGQIPLAYWNFCDALLKETPQLLSQFALETILEHITVQAAISPHNWTMIAQVMGRLLVLKRRSLRHRLHLVTAAFTALLNSIRTASDAHKFGRFVESLCNPSLVSSRGGPQELTSIVGRERRSVAKHAGVLLQNIVFVILQSANEKNEWTNISSELRQACFELIDLIYGDGLKSVTAGMDSASRAYLRSIWDDYKIDGHWSKD